MEVLPEGSRDTKPMELAYEDLEKLSGEEVMRICEWLTDKVMPLPSSCCLLRSSYSLHSIAYLWDLCRSAVAPALLDCCARLLCTRRPQSWWLSNCRSFLSMLYLLGEENLAVKVHACQVDGFSARIKPEPKDVEEEEEEGIGDVDLFALDKESKVLTVNSKWLYHLQVTLIKTCFTSQPWRVTQGNAQALCCKLAQQQSAAP